VVNTIDLVIVVEHFSYNSKIIGVIDVVNLRNCFDLIEVEAMVVGSCFGCSS
jgi:hypothetical protein